MSHARPELLADRIPVRIASHPFVRDATLVALFALLTGIAAQFKIHLGFTPVPVTGQTLAVLLAGASLGASRGAASQGLYWLLGLVGMPVYADGTGGWSTGTGPTMGYLVGFIVAAGVVGRLAEHRHDRALLSSLAAMTLGSLVIYSFGASWLAIDLGIPLATGDRNAITLGVTPFLLGDIMKMIVASAATSGVWKWINRA